MVDEYKVPQNLEVEEKIIGPFSLKQFGFLVGGVLVIYIIYLTLQGMNMSLGVILAATAPIGVLTIAIVFVRVNEKSFLAFLAATFSFLKNPKVMKWQKASKLKDFGTMMKVTDAEKEKQKEMAKLARGGVVKSRLNDLALTLDTKGWDADAGDEQTQGRVASPGVVQSALRTNVKADENLEELPLD